MRDSELSLSEQPRWWSFPRLTFFLDKKSNKKIKTAKCFPAHLAFALQISQNHRAVPSGPTSHPQAFASARS